MQFPFDESQNVAVFICRHVLEDVADICYVSHDKEDGCWQFLCGSDHHIETDIRIISLRQAYDLDHSIAQLEDMPLGCGAFREKKDLLWQGFKQ